MRRTALFLAAALACAAAQAQNIDEILAMISDNNLTLKAMKQQVEASSEANLADAALASPEIEFGYLFGEDGRRRHDLGVSQSFDFGDLTGARRKAALGKNTLLSLEYRASRRDILTQARKLVYQIINRNALIEEYTTRAENARKIEQAYRKGLESGEFSIIDYRKASASLNEAEGRLRLCETERDGMLAQLKNLNGGNPVSVTATSQETVLLPASFEQWLEEAARRSSTLEYVRSSTMVSEQQLKLSRSEALPSLSLGYKAEVVPGEGFRGLSVGISIPIWSAGRKISSAKKQLEAAQTAEQDALIQFRTNAKALYDKAESLAGTAGGYGSPEEYRQTLSDLGKALESGQMSLLDYMNELSYFYGSRELQLQTQLEYMLAVADLFSLEM